MEVFMKRSIILLSILILFSHNSFSQDISRGVSSPGSIGKKAAPSSNSITTLGIHCQILFDEPSGDNSLTKGETGIVSMKVINNSEKKIQPKLNITVSSSWSPEPKSSVKNLGQIPPGKSGSYESKLRWSDKLPAGTITFSINAVDRISGTQTDPADVSFNISGKIKKSVEDMFVDVDKMIPKCSSINNNGIAVIIGNKDYTHPDVPDVEFALNDAQTMKKYLIDMLGYKETNIIYIENANKPDFETVFGTSEYYKGKLFNWVKPNQSDVFIYYSGHGAPDLENKKAYFMPSNSDPNYVKINGYSLDVFYRNLDKIKAKSMALVLDACFSGGSQQGMLISNASPMFIDMKTPIFQNNFNLFTSAKGDQIASWFPKGNHSLFTYYFLRAIRGEADKNRDRKVTVLEIENYLKDNVQHMARRLYGREQTPVINGIKNNVISTY